MKTEKIHDIVGLCNALVDILVEAEERDIQTLGLTKGVMHLVDSDRQRQVLAHFAGKPYTVELGGSAMNAIRTMASLGSRAVFAGLVGQDEFGTRISERLHQLRITSRLGLSLDSTGSCVILVTPDGERTMNTHLGASRLYDEELVPHTDIAHARVLHFCGYQWDTDGQKRAVSEAIATAKRHGTAVSFDVADPFVVARNRDDFARLIAEEADIVFANREEAKLLYGTSPEQAAEAIAATGAVAVVKLGGEGALVRRGKETHHIPPAPTHVVDTTAAGDMFAAGFLYGYTSNRPLAVCGRMGAHLASDVISRIGATVSNAALAEVPGL